MKTSGVVIIGGGRVGLSLGLMFQAAGTDVRAVLVRENSARANALFPQATIEAADATSRGLGEGFSEEFKRELATAAILLFALPDAVLDGAVRAVAEAITVTRAPAQDVDVIAVHTAGAKTTEVFSPLAKIGIAVGALHPCYPFFRVEEKPPSSLVITFSGDEKAARRLEPFFHNRGVSFIQLPPGMQSSAGRELYHAANVLCAGHVATLLAAAENKLNELGISSAESRLITQSLLSGEMELLRSGLPLAQGITGPFARGDEAIIERQEGLLKELGALYQAVGRVSQALKRYP